jgi:hypothetical protein
MPEVLGVVDDEAGETAGKAEGGTGKVRAGAGQFSSNR